MTVNCIPSQKAPSQLPCPEFLHQSATLWLHRVLHQKAQNENSFPAIKCLSTRCPVFSHFRGTLCICNRFQAHFIFFVLVGKHVVVIYCLLQQISTGEILLVPELSFMTGIPEKMKKDFRAMKVNMWCHGTAPPDELWLWSSLNLKLIIFLRIL